MYKDFIEMLGIEKSIERMKLDHTKEENDLLQLYIDTNNKEYAW